MLKRIITGIIGLMLFTLILWLGERYYSVVLFFFSLATYIEYSKMKGFSWKKPEVVIGLILIVLVFCNGLVEKSLLPPVHLLTSPYDILFPFILLCFWMVLSKNSFHLYEMGYLFVGAIYIGYGFTFMMETMWAKNGLALTLLVCFVTWANDTGAYFIGRKWGTKKLWPTISPKKTVEGSIAGIGFGLFVSILLYFVFPSLGNVTVVLGFALLISIVGQLGDLIESSWKRTIGVKDSGTILPGHGGLFDRFDSLLFTFIVLYTFGLLG